MYFTTDGGATWTPINHGLSKRWIQSCSKRPCAHHTSSPATPKLRHVCCLAQFLLLDGRGGGGGHLRGAASRSSCGRPPRWTTPLPALVRPAGRRWSMRPSMPGSPRSASSRGRAGAGAGVRPRPGRGFDRRRATTGTASPTRSRPDAPPRRYGDRAQSRPARAPRSELAIARRKREQSHAVSGPVRVFLVDDHRCSAPACGPSWPRTTASDGRRRGRRRSARRSP